MTGSATKTPASIPALALPNGAMPVLGFGTWQIKGEACVNAVKTALETGYRHIDTAQIYGNEEEVGQALAGSGVPRGDIFLTTKVWRENYAAADVESSVNESLRKLRTDYVDLLLIHWPSDGVAHGETLAAMKKLQEAGKVKNIGVSNFTVALMQEAKETLGYDIACNQVEYHALLSQKPVLDYARQHDIAVTAYSPLAQGAVRENATLQQIAGKYGRTAEQVALRWLVDQPGVAAIPKASSEKHIRANFEIFDFTLSDEDRAAIDALNASSATRIVSPQWAPAWDGTDKAAA